MAKHRRENSVTCRCCVIGTRFVLGRVPVWNTPLIMRRRITRVRWLLPRNENRRELTTRLMLVF